MSSLSKKQSLPWIITAIMLFSSIAVITLTNAKHEKDIEALKQSNEQINVVSQTGNRNHEELLKEDKNNQILSGRFDVEGKGIIVTLTDKKLDNTKEQEYGSLSLVNEADIRNIINELTNAGAEVISVNDERLIANSEIMCMGMKIKINNNEYDSPFIIKAIGNAEIMEAALEFEGSPVKCLVVRGIGIETERKEKLFIPKIKNDVQFKYAEPVGK